MFQPTTISGLQPMGTVEGGSSGFSKESILQALTAASNPIQMTVHNKNDNNPCFTILQQYNSLIMIDKIRLTDGKCLTCYFGPTSTTEVTNKSHKQHVTQHGPVNLQSIPTLGDVLSALSISQSRTRKWTILRKNMRQLRKYSILTVRHALTPSMGIRFRVR